MPERKLTIADISDWVGSRSFDRGLAYARSGHVIDPRREGDVLRSGCWGSAAYPYQVEIVLGPEGIEDGSCSCPVGGGGRCKHAAALLLTWLGHSEEFPEVKDISASLDQLSKEELIALIRRMLARSPELHGLLEIEVARPREGEAIDADWVKRQVLRAFSEGGDDWQASYRIASDLHHVLQPGAGYTARAEWGNAYTLYSTVARMVMDQYGEVHEEEGELVAVLGECGEGLAECLATDDAQLRGDLLRILFDIYRWDTDMGGYGAADAIPSAILAATTSDEKKLLAQWVRDALPSGAGYIEDYRRESYGALLLALEEEWLDDEAYLRLCRETGRWTDLTERLLALGRVDEAVAAAREQSDYTLLGLADLFVAHGQGALARQLVGERVPLSKDQRLLGWLRAEAIARGDLATALGLTERLFWARPGLSGYLEMKELARALGLWDDFQAPLLVRLEEQSLYSLLTEIHLHEGEVEEALETYEQTVQTNEWRVGWGNNALRVQVAEAAARDFPHEAVRLFAEHAERLIDGRSRGAYAEAAQYLLRVRELYRRLSDEAGWTEYITALRDRHRRLRALHDEMRMAGV
jgi:uncharacterized Zn finger protein/tetratricopeptide (TPR) repeat protein